MLWHRAAATTTPARLRFKEREARGTAPRNVVCGAPQARLQQEGRPAKRGGPFCFTVSQFPAAAPAG